MGSSLTSGASAPTTRAPTVQVQSGKGWEGVKKQSPVSVGKYIWLPNSLGTGDAQCREARVTSPGWHLCGPCALCTEKLKVGSSGLNWTVGPNHSHWLWAQLLPGHLFQTLCLDIEFLRRDLWVGDWWVGDTVCDHSSCRFCKWQEVETVAEEKTGELSTFLLTAWCGHRGCA